MLPDIRDRLYFLHCPEQKLLRLIRHSTLNLTLGYYSIGKSEEEKTRINLRKIKFTQKLKYLPPEENLQKVLIIALPLQEAL